MVRVDFDQLTKADLEGVSTVCHLAAISNDPMGNEFASQTMKSRVGKL